MGKEEKTNAMRILDRSKIEYEVIHYDCGEFTDGLHATELSGVPVEAAYKTLVMQGKSGSCYVFVVPVSDTVNLKKAAKAVGEKSVEMLHTKDITGVTGYIRGGCSPIGMKKQFPTVIDESAKGLEKIYVSGGRVGVTICLSPADLQRAASAEYAQVV
ncbi:MAG: Cys-tRNA(Pro) deacylase [Clostridium sp.]|nr:Cys-tRNA(Pro) deacylase [Clostridium sp.]